MSESEPPNAAPTDDREREERPASVPADAAPAAKDAPLWAQALTIAVIVSAASWWLLSERQQERSAEVPTEPKPRSVTAEEPDPQAQMAEAVDDAQSKAKSPAPVSASASPSEPEVEQTERAPD